MGYLEERNAELQKIRDSLLAVNLYSEIPEKKRTEEQGRILEEAEEYLRVNGLDVFDLTAKPLFDDIRIEMSSFGEEDPENVFVRWSASLDNCYPPKMTRGTPNPGEFEEMFMAIYTGQNTVGGVYEEARAMLENFDRALSHAEKVCSAVWNFEKVTRSKPVFSALIPEDIERYVRRIAQYLERSRKRWDAFEASFNTLVQLKNINLGTPSQPYRMTEANTGQPAARPIGTTPSAPANQQSAFKGGGSPRPGRRTQPA